MRIVLTLFFSIFLSINLGAQQQAKTIYDPTTVELSRIFGKELFDANGVNYIQPLASALNSTSNAGFFNTAYVPSKVKFPYFRISVNGMAGIVRDDQKTYKPSLPTEPYDQATVLKNLGKYGSFSLVNGQMKFNITGDTSQLMAYIFKLYVGEALRHKNIINLPDRAPTILGSGQPSILVDRQLVLDSVVKTWPQIGFPPFVQNQPVYYYLDSNLRKRLDTTILKFPELFHLPAGGNLNTLYAGIPQLEFGSFWGTEALVRFIPPVNMGSTIGDFYFWGIGLKHSISQYFGSKRYVDIAIQGVYQGTGLKNKVPESGAELNAKATIYDLNLQISKNLWNCIDIYSGLSYEAIQIQSDYKYYLPVEVQMQLNLLEGRIINGKPTIMPPGYSQDGTVYYPGDNQPQYSSIKLTEKSFKWVIGLRGEIGPFALYADYSVGNFNIFSGGFQMDINRIYYLFKTGKYFNDGNYNVSISE